MGHWGPHFPRIFDAVANRWNYRHWGQVARGLHFPEAGTIDVIPPVSPSGAGAFELVLENEARVTFSWMTGVSKAFDGREKRASIVDDPALRFEGEAVLIGEHSRAARARLARYAALGTPFMLGLPYEAIAVTQDCPLYTLTVPSTAGLDWCVPGQPAIVQHPAQGSLLVTIQSSTATTIVIDVPDGTPLGARGAYGAVVMPAIAIYLDAQQGFARYPTTLERWQLRARNAAPGFQQQALWADLDLTSPVTSTPVLQGVRVQAREAGADGNTITVRFVGDGGTPGSLVEDVGLRTIVVHYNPGLTPASRLNTLFASSTLARIIGIPAGTLTPLDAGSAFGPTALSGGLDGGVVPAGLGVTLQTFEGRVIWDRGIDVDGTANDSLQSMNEPQDLGGLPFTAQTADRVDWGRSLSMTRAIRPGQTSSEWQWLKKFLYTVKGSWKSFWLPTWRPDLVATAVGVGTLVVESGEASGDFFAWYPTQRDHLMTRHATSGALTYLRITNAVDNGNGTITLSVVDSSGTPVSLSGTPELVSWLEVCRLESDQVMVSFEEFSFSMQTIARAVYQ